MLIVEVDQAVGSNDRAMFFSGRRIDMRELGYIVPIFGRLPDAIDFLRHIEVAGGEIAGLVSREINNVAVIR